MKELTGVVGIVVGKKRYLLSFEDGSEKDLILNQITAVKEERSLETKES